MLTITFDSLQLIFSLTLRNIVTYHMVHSLRDGHSKVWIGEFWMKENFWTQKSFITYINFKIFLCNGIHATVFFYVFLWICVEFIEFFCYIRTYIAISEKKKKIYNYRTNFESTNYRCICVRSSHS